MSSKGDKFLPFAYGQRVKWLATTADATAQDYWHEGKVQGTVKDDPCDPGGQNKLFVVDDSGASFKLWKEQLFAVDDPSAEVEEGGGAGDDFVSPPLRDPSGLPDAVQVDPSYSATIGHQLTPREPSFMERSGMVGASAKDSNPKDAVGVGKAYMSTVPQPVLWEVGLAMLEGSLKYGRHNYRKAGVRASVYYDAMKRHLDSWWEGEDLDPETSDDPEMRLHHITKLIASAVVLRDAMMQDMWSDDRPPKVKDAGWLARLNRMAKALLEKYPAEVRKAPFTNVDHGPCG